MNDMARVSLDTIAEDLRRKDEDLQFLSPIEEIIEEARNGRMFILVDDEDRENEGDLVIPAQMATPEVINFMAKFGRGLICLSLTAERVEQLDLPLMQSDVRQRQSTAFTVSIEAREGVTTGISAPDRARTVAAAIDPKNAKDDIVTPGHVFPLRARDGGVLVRAGHTEAAVDIARLAGLNPSGVICEIMDEDGGMARLPELIKFAQYHSMKIGAIADLIAYRRRFDRTIERIVETELGSRFGGEFRMVVFGSTLEGTEHVALVKGDVAGDEPVMVRMHAVNILEDLLGDHHRQRGGGLQQAMEMVGASERGVVVLIRESQATNLSDRIQAELGFKAEGGVSTLKDYGVGAQILLDLGVQKLILLSNSPKRVVGIEGYGLNIIETRPMIRNTTQGA
jgi:3,4-dihydroxy 2-butanone 4-phosphate synthase/GTP cyclohydrolase II